MKGRDLVLGALVGAAAGILLAPKSGKATRKQLKKQSKRLAKVTKRKANEMAGTVSSRASELATTVNTKANDLATTVKSTTQRQVVNAAGAIEDAASSVKTRVENLNGFESNEQVN